MDGSIRGGRPDVEGGRLFKSEPMRTMRKSAAVARARPKIARRTWNRRMKNMFTPVFKA